jgi:3-dehydroquinate dehydratase-2
VAKSPKILILNGPNLNMLGVREPSIYGRDTLSDIAKMCARQGKALGLAVDFRQSNLEGELVTWIQEARGKADGIVINPGGYGHSSIALLDALQIAELPIIEVHLSNIHRREHFRHHTFTSQAAIGVICGLGAKGYVLALDAIANLVKPGLVKPGLINKKDQG